MKISIIGAGNVGATLAMRVLENRFGDVVLVDIEQGVAEGKALDISDAASIVGHENLIIGTSDYSMIKGSDIVVVTAGFPRKPGMSREDLIAANLPIMDVVIKHVKAFCKDAIVIIVTNPLDVLSYYVLKSGGFLKNKVIGMAGTLDTSRFINLISEALKVPRRKISSYVLGSHGDTMVPIISKTTVQDVPLRNVMTEERIDSIVDRTRRRGAEIVSFLKKGSAYYSPSAGVLEILEAICKDSGKMLCVSAALDGEYGISGCFLGVPARIDKSGIREIVTFELEEGELNLLRKSAEVAKKTVKLVL